MNKLLCFMNNFIYFGGGREKSKRDDGFRHLLNLSTVEKSMLYTLIWGNNVGIGLVTEVWLYSSF